MTKCQSSMRFEDGKPQIKSKGIHEPKGRVKGYRVEIRPRNSDKKIWVGTFDTRPKAMRAFDAAVVLTGKDPYYFIYPENYFPTPPTKPSREFVQMQAKLFADRSDVLDVNPASFLVDNSKPGSMEASVTRASASERTTPDVKTAEVMYTPICSKPSTRLQEVDEFLQSVDYSGPAELIPALQWDAQVEEVKSGVEEGKAGVKEGKAGVKEAELTAFNKGYNNPDFDVLGDLLGRVLPESFYPCIEGEDFIPVYSPSRPASKRKRDATEGALSVTDDCKSVGLSTTDVDDWWWNSADDDLLYNTVEDWVKFLETNEAPFL